MNEIDKMRKSELADMENPCQKVIGQDENNDYL